jgi:LuxR family transcriptional regulator, maltose regulon positive regulatory protein
MPTPVLATKLFVPARRPRLVARTRLTGQLDAALDSGHRLTLISAPAGFGKTTLVSDWIDHTTRRRPDTRVAWLSLDEGDNDPTRLLTHLVAALQRLDEGLGAEALALLGAAHPVPVDTTLTALINDLTTTAGHTVLVLDDYHAIEAPAVHDAVTFLLDHLPGQVHLLVASRSDPPLPLARLRTRGELTELRASDLRFTPDEADDFLNQSMGLRLSAGDVNALEIRTEGWVAGLQLAALSLRNVEDASAFIEAFTGSNRFVLDYLVEEVLGHQPEQVRTFLLHTALLDRLTGSLCDALTGRTDGSRMLEDLERANLFVVPLDDQRRWYRYHHLFADGLRARMLTDEREQVRTLHQAASGWYEQHDLLDDAIGHALAAGDFDRAGLLVELALPGIRRTRQDAALLGWLKALPDEEVRRRPVLSVFYGWMLMVSGDLDAVEERLGDAERELAGPRSATWADTDELRTLPMTIATYRASLAQARGDLADMTEHARRVLELAGPEDHLARSGGAGFVALAQWADGDVHTALQTFSQTVTSLRAAGNLADELGTTVVLADMWTAAGRPGKASRLYEDALQLATDRGGSQGGAEFLPTADLHVGLAELDREAGDLDSATQHLETARSLGEGASMQENRYRWFVAAARVHAAAGDPEAATRLLDQAEDRYLRGFFPDVRPIAAMKARLRIAQGDLAPAADWARDTGLSVTDEVSYLAEFAHLTLARLLLAEFRTQQQAGAIDEAVGLLDRLFEPAQAAGRDGSILEIRMLQALALDAQGQQPLALETLDQALAAAPEPEGFVRLFLDEGTPMTSLLRVARGGAGSLAGHARRLLAPGATAGQARVSGPAERLSDRELQVLRLLDSELSGPEIARELFVTLNTLRTHTKHIFTKLGVTSRSGAVDRARDHGLL